MKFLKLILIIGFSLAILAAVGTRFVYSEDATDPFISDELTKSNDVRVHARLLFTHSTEVRKKSLQWMRDRDNQDVIPVLIYALRYVGDEDGKIADLLTTLTEEHYGSDWFKWMLWQQAHPEVKPFNGFAEFQSDLFSRIDPKFRTFIYADIKHEIRLEEITWGGVVKDGIPALTNPNLIDAGKADYLTESEPVFGITINGDVRAYPYRIMDWHEMFNDVIGGVPVSLAYCTLCGSAILYDTRIANRDEPFIFGSSGFLYRSNKLMYDQQTHSLWNQFTGRPVVGELTGSEIQLKVLPVATTTWGEWKKQHPNTKVLSLQTGFIRDYTPGKPYSHYFNSPDLMFPALAKDERLKPKDQVFGLRMTGVQKAWPLTAFSGGKVINDRVGVIQLVLIGDTNTRAVRAYRSEGRKFVKGNEQLTKVKADDKDWMVTEEALIGPDGESLSRLPGHLAYWFAWSGYLDKAEFFSQ